MSYIKPTLTAIIRQALSEGVGMGQILNEVVQGTTEAHSAISLQDMFNHISATIGRQPVINPSAIVRPSLISTEAVSASQVAEAPGPVAENVSAAPSTMSITMLDGNIKQLSSIAVPNEFQTSPERLMAFILNNIREASFADDVAQVWISDKGAIAGRYRHDRVNVTLTPIV